MELRIKNAYTSAVFDCVSEEINSHLSRFTDRKYGKGTIVINDTQRVILTLFLLYRLGLNNLRATHTATLMASLWGGRTGGLPQTDRQMPSGRPDVRICGYRQLYRFAGNDRVPPATGGRTIRQPGKDRTLLPGVYRSMGHCRPFDDCQTRRYTAG